MKYNFLAILTILFCQNALAQKNITITEKVTDKKELLQFAKFEKNINGKDEQSIIETLQSVLKNGDQSFTYKFKQAQTKDELGYEHKEYQQYYKGIKVYGATYAVHIKDGSIDFINGEFANLSNFNIEPIQKAESIFKVAFKEAQNKYKSITEKHVQVSNLVIAKDVFSEKQEYKLGYEVSIKNPNELIDEIYYIDANTGKILNKEFKVCHANTTNAIAQTAYSGTQNYTNGFPISSPNFVTDSYNGAYRLVETRQGVIITTLNNLNSNYSDVGNAVNFVDNDNNWTQAEHGNNKYALDAHWGAEKVFDYWKIVHNRNSINNAGMEIRSYVHSTFDGSPNNAAWYQNKMFYGDGNGTIFGNLTALDVCAHEFGHGICEYTCNLGYNYSESGSLNEGFSDIWGAVIEAWAMPNNPPKNRWLLGEEFYIQSPQFLRSMNNPNSSPNLQPDTYGGTYWTNGSNEPHKGSGILNFWFYLLSDGGCGTNDLNNNYFVPAIGITDAAKIAYKTEQLLSSGSNYSQARTMSIQAAQTLFGSGSLQVRAVTRAWFAVGVGANDPSSNNLFAINGNSSVCASQTQTLTAVNIPNGTTVTSWTANPANTVNLVPNGNTCTVTRNGNSNSLVTISATISTCNGTITATKSINVGFPTTLWDVNGCQYPEAAIAEDIEGSPCNTQCYSPSINKWWCAQPVYNATNVTWQKMWSIPSTYNFWSGSWSGNSNNVSIMFKSPNQSVVLKTTISNPCGSIEQYYCFSSTNVLCSGNFRTADCKQYEVSLIKNTNRLNIQEKSEKCEGTNQIQINLIQIIDKVGNIVKEQKLNDRQQFYELDLSSIKNDIYFVLLQYDNHVETHQIGIFK
jgi:Zn-dependent metalloprotease